MKKGTLELIKTKKLARRLNIPIYAAGGILQSLWMETERNAPSGDIGRFSNEDIAMAIYWDGEPDALINALLECGWLDAAPDDCGRLIVHDWPDHCEDRLHMNLARATKLFADGTVPKFSKLTSAERETVKAAFVEAYGPDVFERKPALQADESEQEGSCANKSAQKRTKAPYLNLNRYLNRYPGRIPRVRACVHARACEDDPSGESSPESVRPKDAECEYKIQDTELANDTRDPKSPPGDIDPLEWGKACALAHLIETTPGPDGPLNGANGVIRPKAIYYLLERCDTGFEMSGAQAMWTIEALCSRWSETKALTEIMADVRRYPHAPIPKPNGASGKPFSCIAKAFRLLNAKGQFDKAKATAERAAKSKNANKGDLRTFEERMRPYTHASGKKSSVEPQAKKTGHSEG